MIPFPLQENKAMSLIQHETICLIQHEAICRLKKIIQGQKARISDQKLLNQIIQELVGSRTSPEAYQILLYLAPSLFPGIQGSLYLRSEAQKPTFERVAAWGGFKQRQRIFTQDHCRALHRMKPHFVEHQECNGPICKHADLSKKRCCFCIPLMVDSSALGLLHLRGDQEELTPWKRERAEELATYCALVLNNLRLRELLSEQAVRDPLTRLFNRRHMEESLERELAVRTQRPVGVIMIDIDHFKKFNTRFTHDGGDELLRAFGAFLQKQVRPGDVACRYGGEEFMLILPGASLDVTEHRAEKMRKEVKLLKVSHRARPLGHISLSLGVSVSGAGSQAEEVLEAADRALLQAKQDGRNRVVVAPCRRPEGLRNGTTRQESAHGLGQPLTRLRRQRNAEPLRA
jgi:diguanylate cyclase (GGDEF)-like protein